MPNTDSSKLCHSCMRPLNPGQTFCPHCGNDNRVFRNEEDILREETVLSGRYIIGRMLGRGGFGVTYIGYDLERQERIAVKEYFPAGICSRSPSSTRVRPISANDSAENFYKGLNAFQKEAEMLSRFESPYIVRVRDFVRENGTAYILMDYVGGVDLNEALIRSGGRMPWERVTALFCPLITEIGKLHEQKLIHRDIKPANIKLVPAENGKPEHLMLLDFGAARNYTDHVTKTYTAMLTRGFAPIEQYSTHSHQGPYTDVYALCATMYNCLTGTVPPASMDLMIGGVTLTPISDFGIRVPQYVQRAIAHGMELQADKRTQTMEKLYSELHRRGSGTQPKKDERKKTLEKARKAMGEETAEGYQEALNLLKKIPGYRDADELILDCRQKLLEEQAAAVEPVPEIPVPAAEQPKQERKRYFWLLPVLMILAVISAVLIRVFSPDQVNISAAETAVSLQSRQTENAVFTAFIQTKTAEPTATPEPESPLFEVGDVILFGQYEQDNDISNGTEPIEWQVLAVEDDRVLVISKYGLDAKPFDISGKDVSWETSSLREWLNGVFFSSTFTSEEQVRIIRVTNENPDNSLYGTKGGNSTEDRIFLLSYEEASRYFAENSQRMCFATAYAQAMGTEVNPQNLSSYWWLRSPGIDRLRALSVFSSGALYWRGDSVDSSTIVVRPAFWLNSEDGSPADSGTKIPAETENPTQTEPAVDTLTPTVTETPGKWAELKPGDFVTFGRYEQDNDLANGAEPIEWQVLAVNNGQVLIISKYALDAKPYHEKAEKVTWADSSIRKWLNGEFFSTVFSFSEQDHIIPTANRNPDNPSYSSGVGGSNTVDRVFLLSIEEAKQFLDKNIILTCEATDWLKAREGSNTGHWWWLRSPGRNRTSAAVVNTYGFVYTDGFDVSISTGAVRPALVVDLSDASVFTQLIGTAATETEELLPESEQEETVTPEPDIEKSELPSAADPLESLTEIRVGDRFTFGMYMQEKAGDYEPIEWQVLAVEDDRALVISRYALDARAYDTSAAGVTWETCSLRSWLNGAFFRTAFGTVDQSLILQVTNDNPDNPEYGTYGGKKTTDQIFLLSLEEAKQYFPDDAARECSVTEYARKNGVYIGRGYDTVWWLRSPGSYILKASVVGTQGKIDDSGYTVNYTHGAIRPAFWLNLDALGGIDSAEELPQDEEEPEIDAEIPQVGDYLTFGHYEQDTVLPNGTETIEWQVLAVEDGKALVISRYVLDTKPYNETWNAVTWETCSLRSWLNGEFFESAFSSSEQAQITQATLKNPDNPDYGTVGGEDTLDRIFLLSIDEANQYFPNIQACQCQATAYAITNGSYVHIDNGNSWWWLRSPGYDSHSSAYVSTSGNVYSNGYYVTINMIGVRPAFWLDL